MGADVRVEEALEPRDPLREIEPSPRGPQSERRIEVDLQRPILGERGDAREHQRFGPAREEKAPVTFFVAEGSRYKVNRLQVTGNTVFDEKKLLGYTDLRENNFYDRKTIIFD